ncbi:MAG: Rieske 2Fe-2S domain-containing protein [Ginsengibacter sp.]
MKLEKQYQWVKIANDIDEISFLKNGIAEIHLPEKNICIADTSDGLRAFAATCPHAGASLAESGELDSRGNINCCVHNYRFSLKHGRDPFNEYFLKVFPVKVEHDGIYVGL